MANWRSAWKHVDRIPELINCLSAARDPLGVISDYLNLRIPRLPRTLALRNGLKLELRTYEDLVTAWVVLFRDEYRCPRSARAILDIGANIGTFGASVAMSNAGAVVVCAEPFPPTHARLLETIALNALGPRIKPVPFGIAREPGRRVIPDGNTAPSQSLGMLAPGAEAGSEGVMIDVVTLDELIARARGLLGVEAIDFVKMDVEGAEHESLAAASPDSMRCVRELAMEYHPNGDKAALFGRMSELGFELGRDRSIGSAAGVAHWRRAR